MTRRASSAIVALATALGGIFLFLGMAHRASAEDVSADMSGNTFQPANLTVTAGDTVTWRTATASPTP